MTRCRSIRSRAGSSSLGNRQWRVRKSDWRAGEAERRGQEEVEEERAEAAMVEMREVMKARG